MASHSVDLNQSVASSSIDHHIESREESIEKLKVALVRYGRANDRRMVLRTLKNVSFLSYIPMEVPVIRNDVSLSELEKEVFLEQLIINETLLSPPSESRTIKNAGTNSGCLVILKGLTKALCANTSLKAKKFVRSCRPSFGEIIGSCRSLRPVEFHAREYRGRHQKTSHCQG
uniref:Uncharacterized protein n=1 Tax=Pseudo-nitzschia delicatissima TaxID=44447 RepID=A0A7S0XLH1_9STRA|mmetsp:Transcript_611/g.1384  ORF Transcript_611/g.1384 Transcript_611/m.1384 type:complete len:173 (+) Transcript_611:1-519(+)